MIYYFYGKGHKYVPNTDSFLRCVIHILILLNINTYMQNVDINTCGYT